MSIEPLLTQTTTLKSAAAADAGGTRATTSSTIPCRFEWGARVVTKIGAELVMASGRLFTTSFVKVGDSIHERGRDWPVIASYEKRDLFDVSHYEVYI